MATGMQKRRGAVFIVAGKRLLCSKTHAAFHSLIEGTQKKMHTIGIIHVFIREENGKVVSNV
jgi:hypothetical protein